MSCIIGHVVYGITTVLLMYMYPMDIISISVNSSSASTCIRVTHVIFRFLLLSRQILPRLPFYLWAATTCFPKAFKLMYALRYLVNLFPSLLIRGANSSSLKFDRALERVSAQYASIFDSHQCFAEKRINRLYSRRDFAICFWSIEFVTCLTRLEKGMHGR